MEENGRYLWQRAFIDRLGEHERRRLDEVDDAIPVERPIDTDTSQLWKFYKNDESWCLQLTGFPSIFIHDLAVDVIEESGTSSG